MSHPTDKSLPHPVTPRKADLASLLLRAALAGVFIYHGVDKIFSPGNAWGTNWLNAWVSEVFKTPPIQGGQSSAYFNVLQAVVAWGELVGGVALILGIFTRPAAIGLFLLQAAALFLIAEHPDFSYDRRGGFEYNIVIMTMCLALLVLGPGRLALDRLFHRARHAAEHASAPSPVGAGAAH